jgi:hypothetical protein
MPAGSVKNSLLGRSARLRGVVFSSDIRTLRRDQTALTDTRPIFGSTGSGYR